MEQSSLFCLHLKTCLPQAGPGSYTGRCSLACLKKLDIINSEKKFLFSLRKTMMQGNAISTQKIFTG